LVRARYRKVSQQIEILAVPVIGNACAWLAIDRLNTHFSAQALESFAVHSQPVFAF
jgi:hypothetical protein